MVIVVVFLYQMFSIFDNIVVPNMLSVAEYEMKTKTVDVINEVILEECSESFKYDEVINIDKDKNDNIVMLKADTIKLNKIAVSVSLKAQDKIKELGAIGVSVPLGYVTQNSFVSNYGPNIKIKMKPIGSVETKYISEFESAGINQTRHKIYVETVSNIQVILLSSHKEIEVKHIIPISETIIVGKIPDTSIDLNLNKDIN
nr:sporulation protein YunB [Clostridium cellulovorans]